MEKGVIRQNYMNNINLQLENKEEGIKSDNIKINFDQVKIVEKSNVFINNTIKNTSPGVLQCLKIEDIYAMLGGYSWFQLWITIVILLPEIPASMISIAPVFIGSTSQLSFKCIEESGDNDEIMSRIVNNSMLLCLNNCTRLIPVTTDESYYYDSIVEEWNLICDDAWLTDTFTSIQMAGMMTGAFLGSIMADKYGRKKCFYLTCFAMMLFSISSGLAFDIYSYGISKFCSGIGIGGFYVVFNIYLMEFLTPSYRTIAGCVSIWCIGEMILALLAYYIHSWRILTILCGLPTILIFITFPFVPESPRWLLCENRTKEATAAFKQIAKWNAKPNVDHDLVLKLQEEILAEKKLDSEMTSSSSAFPILSILTNPKMALPLVLFLFGWFSCALVYYGITFNTKSLSGSPYLNVLFLGLVDLPAFPSGGLFSHWIGRKKTYSSCLIIGSIFLIGIVVLELTLGLASVPTLTTIFCFAGRFGICAAWGIVSCFTAETFPTVSRTTCLGLCSLFSNIGGVLAPQLAYLATFSEALPYFIFCGLTVTSATLSLFLEETHGKPLENFAH